MLIACRSDKTPAGSAIGNKILVHSFFSRPPAQGDFSALLGAPGDTGLGGRATLTVNFVFAFGERGFGFGGGFDGSVKILVRERSLIPADQSCET